MICKKCGFEYFDNLQECPNCQTDNQPKEAKVLQAEERDTFKGVTIDEAEGAESTSYKRSSEKRTEDIFEGTRVYHTSFSAGGFSFLWQILFLIAVAAIVFILLPAFLLVFIAIAALVFILRLFK